VPSLETAPCKECAGAGVVSNWLQAKLCQTVIQKMATVKKTAEAGAVFVIEGLEPQKRYFSYFILTNLT